MYYRFVDVCTRQSYIHSKPFSAAFQLLSSLCTFTSSGRSTKVKQKALKLLDFLGPKTGKTGHDECHHRLIQSCMQDLLEIGQCSRPSKETKLSKLRDPIQVDVDNVFYSNVSACWRTNILLKDALLSFHDLHKRGISPDETTLSGIISSFGAKGTLDTGVQLHALSVKIGLDKSIFVGSSLISLYSKSRQLNNADQVFQAMPEKNTVTWTAIIAGYAQHWQVGTCLYLFNLMRQFLLKPNDFTCASLLSACTNCASLGVGRSLHCLELRLGFDTYVHVLNALVSMYSKCGDIEEARNVFDKMQCKDLISWNSMIFGYAQYGIADQAIDLLRDMEKHNVLPDAISFLGVLSSCRHAGLVEKGRHCFRSMLEHGIKPELDHYSCIVDLLGRVGLLEEALDFIEKMPIPPNAIIWGSLLSSCRVHGNVWIGIHAAKSRLLLEPGCPGTHVQLANLYASVGCWNHAAKVRKLMKDRGLKTSPGYSWIEIGNRIYRFKAEDRSNSQIYEMLIMLDSLEVHMKLLARMTI